MSQRFDLFAPARGQNFTGETYVPPTAVPTTGEYAGDNFGSVELAIGFTQAVTLDSVASADWSFNSVETGNVYTGNTLVFDGGKTLQIKVFAAGPGNSDEIVTYTNNADRLKGPGGVPVASFTEALEFAG